MTNFPEKYKTIFLQKRGWGRLPSHIGKFVLGCLKNLNRIFWAIQYWYKAQKWKTWSTNTKLIVLESEAILKTFWKLSLYIVISNKFVLKSFIKGKSKILSDTILVQGLKIPNLLNEYKEIFLGKTGVPNTYQSFYSHIGITYE